MTEKNNAEFESKLNNLRDEIDTIDSQLVELLAKRLNVTSKVGQLKSKVGMPIYDPIREKALFNKRRQQAVDSGISGDLI